MAKRDFLAVTDLSRDEVVRLFDLAHRMKTGAYRETPLAGKTLAMIFAKSSTRTRVSFEVGTYQLGGHALFLSSRDIQIGRGEPIPDTARVLKGTAHAPPAGTSLPRRKPAYGCSTWRRSWPGSSRRAASPGRPRSSCGGRGRTGARPRRGSSR